MSAIVACHCAKSIERSLQVDRTPGGHCNAVPARRDGADYTKRLEAGLLAEVMEILTQRRAMEDPLR